MSQPNFAREGRQPGTITEPKEEHKAWTFIPYAKRENWYVFKHEVQQINSHMKMEHVMVTMAMTQLCPGLGSCPEVLHTYVCTEQFTSNLGGVVLYLATTNSIVIIIATQKPRLSFGTKGPLRWPDYLVCNPVFCCLQDRFRHLASIHTWIVQIITPISKINNCLVSCSAYNQRGHI